MARPLVIALHLPQLPSLYEDHHDTTFASCTGAQGMKFIDANYSTLLK